LLIVGVCLYLVVAGVYGFWAYRKVNQWSQQRAERISASPKVWITPEGTKYHGDRHLADQSRQISLYEAKEADLQPCRTCFRQRLWNGYIAEHPIERQAEDIQVLTPLPWHITHWGISLILLAVVFSALYLLASGVLGPQASRITLAVVGFVLFVLPVIMIVGWLLEFVPRQIERLPRYMAGLILGGAFLLWLWKRGFKLRS
jgi:hypothetical protein